MLQQRPGFVADPGRATPSTSAGPGNLGPVSRAVGSHPRGGHHRIKCRCPPITDATRPFEAIDRQHVAKRRWRFILPAYAMSLIAGRGVDPREQEAVVTVELGGAIVISVDDQGAEAPVPGADPDEASRRRTPPRPVPCSRRRADEEHWDRVGSGWPRPATAPGSARCSPMAARRTQPPGSTEHPRSAAVPAAARRARLAQPVVKEPQHRWRSAPCRAGPGPTLDGAQSAGVLNERNTALPSGESCTNSGAAASSNHRARRSGGSGLGQLDPVGGPEIVGVVDRGGQLNPDRLWPTVARRRGEGPGTCSETGG